MQNPRPSSAVQQILWGLITIALIFMLVIISGIWHAYRINEVKDWTLHTHIVIEELKDALIALQDLESSARGFVISGDKRFLRFYDEDKAAIQRHLQNVKELTMDNPAQSTLVKLAQNSALEKFAFSDAIISEPNAKAGQALVASGRGLMIMETFKKFLDQLVADEQELLAKRVEHLNFLQTLNKITTALLALLIIFLLGWIYRMTRRAIADEQKRVLLLETEVEERRKVEADLLGTSLKLRSSNVDLQQFAYVASHDLQEPLRAISGFLTLIVSKNKGNLDDETEAWINHAVEGAQRMRTLINDLLSYARVESQGKEFSPTDCNLALHQATKDLAVLLAEHKVSLKADSLPTVMGDTNQLAQVFQNLIANAVKFKSGEPPSIIIRVVERHSEWIFSVEDNGIGFDEEHAKRIFVIFQRLHGREEYSGTGIGLALCKKIVERHGGRIWAQSEPGKGSTFFFTIPVLLSRSVTISGDATQSHEKKHSPENSAD